MRASYLLFLVDYLIILLKGLHKTVNKILEVKMEEKQGLEPTTFDLLGGNANRWASRSKYKVVNIFFCFQDMVPYKSTMLLQVKGRRICQTRLVNPCKDSINSGDAYVLITPKDIYNWVGEFSNVIERSRSAEIAATILQKKDLGCKGIRKVVTIEEEKVTECHSYNRKFWEYLGCSTPPTKVIFYENQPYSLDSII